MCIRDRPDPARGDPPARRPGGAAAAQPHRGQQVRGPETDACLLYTSDAADERSSVDLGGRRIIKKKK